MDPRAQQLAQFFRSKGSPLAQYAPAFVAAADRYGLDYRILPAISGIETSFGTAGTGLRGPFGYGSAKDWGSTERAIDVAAKGLGDPNGYYKNARTISQVAGIWAPPGASNDRGGNSGWPSAVSQFFRQLGGDPSAPIRGVAGQAAPMPQMPAQGQAAPAGRLSGPLGSLPAVQEFLREQEAWAAQDNPDLDNPALAAFTRAKAAVQAAVGSGGGRVQGSPSAPAAPAAGGIPLITVGGNQPRLSKWGGPSDHGARALGNWQSDLAFDLGGRAGTAIMSPLAGRVVKVGGQPGGSPQFRGYGVTIDHGGGRQAFYKHLGSLGPGIRAGAQVTPGMLIGGLADGTGGGPHLHLGATSNDFLNALIRYYL